ncbi:hypothetical protein FI667_g9484, partial [Globisporangium splendens]
MPPGAARGFWSKVVEVWDAHRIELHGNYSVERLLQLKTYSDGSSVFHAIAVTILTTFPGLCVVVTLDLTPLESLEAGPGCSHMFWVRAFILGLLISRMNLEQWRYEDRKPEFVIFNIEIAHVLFISCFLQASPSVSTTVVLVLTDLLLLWISLNDIDTIVRTLHSLLHNDAMHGEHSGQIATGRASLQICSISYVDAAIYLLAHEQRIKKDSLIQLSSFKTRVSTNQVRPLAYVSILEHEQSNVLKLIDESKRALSTLTLDAKVLFVRQTLRLLHLTEFVLLVEFTEVMIPIIYSVYQGVVFLLPNRVYYVQLRSIDSETMNHNLANIVAYALIEVLTFVVIKVLLERKLRIPVLHQLAFVLKTEQRLTQLKILQWVVFSVQAPLLHFGMDFSFRFAWLRHQRSVTG